MSSKSILKSGDLIVMCNGEIARVYLNTENGDIVSGDTWFPLKHYSDKDLFINDNRGGTWTGTACFAVWRPKFNAAFRLDKPTLEDHTLIWQRERPEHKQIKEIELQISELSAKKYVLQEALEKPYIPGEGK